MSLPELVKFRDLADQLSQHETQQLLLHFSERHARLILSALFVHFQKNPESSQSVIGDMHRCISNIIETREKDNTNEEDDDSGNPKRLYNLPRALIGVTASFLEQGEYAFFSRTCRSIYLGCNAPNQLQSFDVSHLTGDAFLDLRRFEFAKCFKFSPAQLARLTAHIDGAALRHLERVVVDGEQHFVIDSLVADEHIDMRNVTTLECRYLSGPQGTRQFARLFSKFPNVQYFHVYDIQMTDVNFASMRDSVVQQFLALRGLKLCCTSATNTGSLLNAVGEKLECLDFWPDNGVDLSNTNFSRLRELNMTVVCRVGGDQVITDILKTAIHLRKVRLDLWASVKTETLTGFFTRCEELEYLEIQVDVEDEHTCETFEWILDCIEKGLFETRSLKRDSIKIRVRAVFPKQDDYYCKLVAMKVRRIVRWLEMRNNQDFMLILEADDSVLDAITDVSGDVVLNRGKGALAISNANCRICG